MPRLPTGPSPNEAERNATDPHANLDRNAPPGARGPTLAVALAVLGAAVVLLIALSAVWG